MRTGQPSTADLWQLPAPQPVREDEDIDGKRATELGSPAYTVRAVAERLGVPTPTLRSWNLRYGIGPQQHEAGRHRYFTESDIAVLEQMVELVRKGASPGSAARTAIAHREAAAPDLGDLNPVLDAAFLLDTVALLSIFDRHFRHHGVIATWDRLCRTAFAAVVNRQDSDGGCIDVEHVLSWAVVTSLHRLPQPVLDDRATVILACTENESHSLPLEALRAALAEIDIGARMLGAEVPAAALADALSRCVRPTVVVLWSHSRGTADLSAVHAVLDARATSYVAGPGWTGVDLPAHVERIESLSDAVGLVQR